MLLQTGQPVSSSALHSYTAEEGRSAGSAVQLWGKVLLFTKCYPVSFEQDSNAGTRLTTQTVCVVSLPAQVCQPIILLLPAVRY
jgi:hypothetical protein